jgi:hypothetical protein
VFCLLLLNCFFVREWSIYDVFPDLKLLIMPHHETLCGGVDTTVPDLHFVDDISPFTLPVTTRASKVPRLSLLEQLLEMDMSKRIILDEVK